MKIINTFRNRLKHFYSIISDNKIRKSETTIKTVKQIRTILSNYSDKYSWKYNLDVQQILNLVWQKIVKLKNISYKNAFFFDSAFFRILNLKYKPDVGEWKSSFFILKDLADFLELKWKYLFKLSIFLISFYVLFLINFFSNLSFAFTFYNPSAIKKIKQQYSNPYTRDFFLDKLKRKRKEPYIDKQTLFSFYIVIMFFIIMAVLKKMRQQNLYMGWKAFQSYIIIFLFMSEILNRVEIKKDKPEIWYFNAVSSFRLIIKELKQQKTISISLYNDLISTLNEKFQVKRNTIEPALYSFMKATYSLQLEGEIYWFDWKLNRLTQIYIESKNLLLERMSLTQHLYDLLVNVPPVWFYILAIVITSSYIGTLST